MKTLLLLASLWFGASFANGDIIASPYGPVVSELLRVMHASVVPCEDLLDAPELCFTVDSVGLSLLAGVVGDVAKDFEAAGLRSDPWLAGNGVHSVRLVFDTSGPDALYVYLAEDSPSHVRGLIRLSPR